MSVWDKFSKRFGKKDPTENGTEILVTVTGDDTPGEVTADGTVQVAGQTVNASLSPSGGVVSNTLSNAFRKISTGNLMPELHVSSQSPAGKNQDQSVKTDKPPAPPVVDVVIVGAGLAGLSAAYTLRMANQGISVVVLEASERVGGRVLTREMESANGRDFWDLGAQWIGGSQVHMMQLADELELQTCTGTETGSHFAHFADGRKLTFETDPGNPLSSLGKMDYGTFITKVEKLRLEVSLENPEQCPLALEWDSITLEQFRKQHIWTAAAQQFFDAKVKIAFGVPPCQMSTLFFLFALNSAGGWNSLFQSGSETVKEFRIKGGTQRLCEIIVDKINRSFVKLGDPVVAINQRDSELADVQTLSGKHFRSERVIVALPPKFAGRIHYAPPLPADRDSLLQMMHAGHSLQFVITYKENFWQKIGYSGNVIRMMPSAVSNKQADDQPSEAEQIPFTALFDATSTMDQSPALCGTVEAKKWREIPEEERKGAIVAAIGLFFGVEAHEPLDYTEIDWGAVPYCSHHLPSVLSPGAMTKYFYELKKPFQRIHWAGADTTERWYGFMDGAVHSGKRAAAEVQSELRPDVVISV
ncbi:probable flavin-containing monoamine oxidase A isoform X1 [Asterias rubens]|uniref:probable flavin-containing monoamine oxidase A isoform X1 n=1 Tax=Asterias rubens TaxID=7604 RepID=UPI001454EF88|nr:probable flavin-containing monoamine oxidase A isoform X1 [Asterias rubens]